MPSDQPQHPLSYLESIGAQLLGASKSSCEARFLVVRQDDGSFGSTEPILRNLLESLAGTVLREQDLPVGLEIAVKLPADKFQLLIASAETGQLHETVLDKELLHRGIATICADGEDTCWSGHFVDLLVESQLAASTEHKHKALAKHLNNAYLDLQNMLTLIDRLEWQKTLNLSGKLDFGQWYHYSSSDIDLLHVQFRSLFDHLAEAIDRVAEKPGQNSHSFDSLRNGITGDDAAAHRARLGADLADVVADCNWFHALRDYRNCTVHFGGTVSVYLDGDRLMFQIHNGLQNLVQDKMVMFNDNVAYLDRYIGLHMGYLLGFLDDLAQVMLARAGMKRTWGGKSRHPALPIVAKWARGLLDA